MSRRAVLAIAGLVVLLLAAIVFREDPRQLTATSYGTGAGGHRALFELLRELGLPAERSFEPPELLEPVTVWWVEPWQLCAAEAEASGLADFVRRGGRAVVFLRTRRSLYAPALAEPCPALAGRSLPGLRAPDAETETEPESESESETKPGPDTKAEFQAEPEPRPDERPPEETTPQARAGLPPEPAGDDPAPGEPASTPTPTPTPIASPTLVLAPPRDPVAQRVDGELTTHPRTLEVPPLIRFAEAGDWEPVLLVDGEPLALSARLERGRLVAVADGTFLRNAWIDGGESALLALDLVRALGVPRIDEHAHGLRLEQSRTVLLAELGALPVFLSVAALAVLLGWRLASVPVGIPAAPPSVRPALDEFVSSLASLYAANRDFAGLAERYRLLALERLRSQLGLAPETPDALLLERLRSRRGVPRERLALLEPGAPAARTRSEWLERARVLDCLLEEVCRRREKHWT